jgi:raffinose/stachyose/melibiose transport system substrate-binding protein
VPVLPGPMSRVANSRLVASSEAAEKGAQVVTIRKQTIRRTQKAGALTAGACAAALLAAACGGSGGGGGGSSSSTGATGSASPKQFTYLTNAENTTIKTELATLAKTSCAAANKALPLTVDTVPQTSLDQKLQLLAGQNALPVQFAAGSRPV